MSDLIQQHVAHLRARGLSRHTIEDRTLVLTRLARDLPHGLDNAAPDELEGWLGHDGWAPATRRVYHSHIAAYFRWAVAGRRPHLDWDPTVELTQPRAVRGLPHPITDEQLMFLLSHARGRWRIAVRLAAYAGMRCGEIADAQRDHFTADGVRITGKGGRSRMVGMHPQVWEIVEPLSGRLMSTSDGRRVDGDWISRYFRHHLDVIGLPAITPHCLRHWFATKIQRQYRDLRVTQELLGHASPATTMIYTQVTDQQRREAVATLPTFATPEPGLSRLGGATA